MRSLFAPIANQVYFAGEHATLLLDVLGTMEAAAESGETAAKHILQDIKLTQMN